MTWQVYSFSVLRTKLKAALRENAPHSFLKDDFFGGGHMTLFFLFVCFKREEERRKHQ